MSNRRCPKCGEEYSDTYRSCPFCEEEEALRHGRPLRRQGGRRVEKRQKNTGGAGGIMLLLTGVIILGVVGYVLFGDDVADAVGIRDTHGQSPASSQAGDPKPPAQTRPEDDAQAPSTQIPDDSGPPQTDEANEGDGPGGADEPAGPLALSQTDITIPAGETGRLIATGGNGEISWTSSNAEIASVDGGAVTGKAGGTVTITATSGEETATCQVKVEGEPWVNPNAKNCRVNKDDFTFGSGETVQMKVKWDGSEKWEIAGPNDGVLWASNQPGVASISETGLVTWVSRGTTTVTATVNGEVHECIVRAK